MDKSKLYLIGEIYDLTKVPRSALRYYDRTGIIKPAVIDADNGYRYYDSDTLQMVLVLRYYQLLGFKLKEIPHLLARENMMDLQSVFEDKVAEENEMIQRLILSRDSLISWIDLIKEAKVVLEQEDCEITLRKFPTVKMYTATPKYLPKMEFKNLLINNELCTSIYPTNTTTLGALHIEYPSEDIRFGGDYNGVRLFIKNHDSDDHLPNVQTIEGFIGVTCYHKGSYDAIGETYEKMKQWAKEHHFDLKGNSIERYVIDYWSTTDEDWIVTEIFLPLK